MDRLLDELNRRRPWLLAIAGIPGSGKSTLAGELARRIPGAVLVPMDGYHVPRASLTPDQMVRRGAPDTFDSLALRRDLQRLRENREGQFPAFDHAVKDPEPGAITVPSSASLVIVEGLYLLLKDWNLADLFDMTVFLNCDMPTALDRVAARHLTSGLVTTLEEGRERANTIDRRHAELILADGCRERANLIL